MATNTTVVQGQVAAKPKAAAGPWREAFGRLIRNRLAIVGLVLVILLLFCGIFGPLIAPWPYQQQDLKADLRQRQPAAAAVLAEPHPRHGPARS